MLDCRREEAGGACLWWHEGVPQAQPWTECVCPSKMHMLNPKPPEGIVRELGMLMYMLLYLKWITNKDLLYSTEDSAQC